MPNLIVILFNLLYPVFYVGFHCKSCVWESVWRFKASWRPNKFSRVAHEKPSVKWSMCLAHNWNAKSHDRWWQLVFESVLHVRPSREISTTHSVLPICHIWCTKSLPILYIPTFTEFFGFFFDNILACYLMFAFFFPTLLVFILLLWFNEYGLE